MPLNFGTTETLLAILVIERLTTFAKTLRLNGINGHSNEVLHQEMKEQTELLHSIDKGVAAQSCRYPGGNP